MNIYAYTDVPRMVAMTVVESFTTRTIAETVHAFTAVERITTRPTVERLEGFSAPEVIYVSP